MSTVHDGHFTMHTGSDSLEKLGKDEITFAYEIC